MSTEAVHDEPALEHVSTSNAVSDTEARGGFEILPPGIVQGWAFDRSHPDAQLSVQVWDNDRLFATLSANGDETRSSAFGGDGKHGFSVDVGSLSDDGGDHVITVRLEQSQESIGLAVPLARTAKPGLGAVNNVETSGQDVTSSETSEAAVHRDLDAGNSATDKTVLSGVSREPMLPSGIVVDTGKAHQGSSPNVISSRESDASAAVPEVGSPSLDGASTMKGLVNEPAPIREEPAQASQAGAAKPTLPPSSPVEKKQSEKADLRRKQLYRGRLDTVINGVAEGWATDPLKPERRLIVEIWEGTKFVAAGEASLDRHDLRKANIGDGRYKFAITLPVTLADDKPHHLRARIAGSDFMLEGAVTHTMPSIGVEGAIEDVEGLTLRGWVRSRDGALPVIDVSCDGGLLTELDVSSVSPGERHAFQIGLPLSLADGAVHWFQLRLRSHGLILGEAVALTPLVSTPESGLQRYAKDFPGFLSHSAANRYAALEGQLAIGASSSDETLGSLSPQDHYRQLWLAHKQVKLGIAEQSRVPDRFTFPVHQRPVVSVVVPAHNKFWVTYNCLAALLLAPNKCSFEVIVVDDGSNDMTMQLADIVSGITLLRNEVAQGFVKSSNSGAASARGDYVVMLNNDTEPCAFWIDELVHVFENFSDVGLAGAKFIYPDGKLQEAGGIVFPNLAVWNYGRNGNPHDPRFNYTRQVDYVSGAGIMLRRHVWEELGGFDEMFAPAYYEDNDLAFRVRAKGLKTYYTPFSKIVHFEGVSSGTAVTSGTKRFQAVNEPKFRERWAATIRRFPLTLDPHLAKDRGIHLRALVIDLQCPQPDKDAGSYAAVKEMRLLQGLDFKLTFVPANMAYMGVYTEALQRAGVECLHAPFQTSLRSVLEQRGREFDVIYITRYSVADQCIDLVREFAPQAKIVFNNADLHFLREIRAALAAKNPDALPAALRTRDAELAVMRRTDVTLSYTDTEAAVIVSHNLDATKVARCPWVVDVDEAVPPFAARTGLAFLGNYQHPPNEEAVRYFINDVMPELRRHVPGIVLKLYGAHMPADLRKLAAADVLVEGYVEDVSEVYHSCRVFIAPLLSGAGIKGKVIGALASATPSVMTSLAGEGVGISRGSQAFIADTTAEWVEAIKTLYTDEGRWTEMSNRARDFARENFSFDRGLSRMKAALAMAGVYVG